MTQTSILPRRSLLAIAVALLLPLPAAWSATPDAMPGTAPVAAAAPARSAVIHPDLWPAQASPIARDPTLEARIATLLARLSVEEKVGQLIQGDMGSTTPADVRKYHLGSVLAGGSSDPNNDYRSTPAAWLQVVDAYRAAAVDTSGGGHGVPLLFGIDAVHGHNNLVGATLFPHNIGLGAARDPNLMREIAAATAAEVRATGIEWTFAPTLAVPRDDRWGRTYEGYAEDPEVVRTYAAPLIEGLQGTVGQRDFLDGQHVVATAKHFLADGGTHDGRDQGDAQIDEATLRDIHGAGYPPALKAGAQTLMASFSSWNGVKMHGNRQLLTDVLKDRWGFDGFVVGDWNAHGQVDGCSNTNCAAAFNAGLDMAMASDSWKGLYENTLAQVKSGVIPMSRLDDAVTRILRVKFRAGLFDGDAASRRGIAERFSEIGAAKHREIARRAVRESLVLLKNNDSVLPLDPRRRLLVAGTGADNVSQQSGGWTLSWQGTGVTPADFPNAQSIWAGVAEQVAAAGGKAELAVDGRYTAKPDAAIVVFGEEPYAEFQGDLRTVAYKPPGTADLDLLKRLKAEGIPVVAVFLSGRPLWVNREINASDAFVAAWLPGSEGAGIADVLLRDKAGRVANDFHGVLSYSWPATAVQTPLNRGDAGYAPQFAYGYGLRYDTPTPMGTLPEDPGIDLEKIQSEKFVSRGALSQGWQVRVTGNGAPFSTATIPAPGAAAHGITLDRVDHMAQEDAWRIRWTGPGRAAIALVPPAPLDLARETNGDAMLLLSLRLDATPSPDTVLQFEHGAGLRVALPIGAQLAALPKGQWLKVGLPLKCYQAANGTMSHITVPVEMEAGPGTAITLHEVGYGTDATQVLACPKPL